MEFFPRVFLRRRSILVLILLAISGSYTYREYTRRADLAQRPPGRPIYTEAKPALATYESYAAFQEEIENSRRNAIVRAIELVEPAVVSISVVQVRIYRTTPFSAFFNDPFFEKFFPELRRKVPVKGLGSGFIVSEDGYILTNEHVVHNAVKIVVNLPDGRKFEAKLMGADESLDIAVLKIRNHGLPFVRLGDSDDVIIGEWAIAIGNPFGYVLNDPHPSVSVGVISALGRNFGPTGDGRVYQDMLQTDAAINLGNSGGPLVNSRGEVIGINTVIFTGSEWERGWAGIGFAIPINKAKRVLDEIARYGRVREFWTGITIQDIDPLIAESLGLKSAKGVIVTDIVRGSPADKAGLKIGDVIVRVNGKKVKGRKEIQNAFLGARVGDVYRLDIIRGGQEMVIKLTLAEAPKR